MAPEVLFSNMNVGMSPALLWTPNKLGAFVSAAGFDGVELFPLVWPVERYATAEGLVVRSLHQSFRMPLRPDNTNSFADEGVRTSVDIMLTSPFGRLLMPTIDESVTHMAKMQKACKERLPGVFYPRADEDRDRIQLIASMTTDHFYQPTDHVARLIGAENPQVMVDMLSMRGYTGLVYDVFHARRVYPNTQKTVSDVESSLPVLAPQVKSIHLSLGRLDFAKVQPHIPTVQELSAMLQGTVGGQLGEILQILKAQQPKSIVLEVTMGALKAVTHKKDVLGQYRSLVETTRSFFA